MSAPTPVHPQPLRVPVRPAEPAPGSPAQQHFREAILAVERLREQVREQQAAQAEARRRYWQHVGPAAEAVVQARRALYAPLEEALLQGYFSRLEEQQITAFIVGNARALQDRFGEDETAVLRKYAPAAPPAATAPPPTAAPAEDEYVPELGLAPHEQAAAAARFRRQAQARRRREAAARADQEQLAANTKTLYRQLARTHHPDLERDPARQAEKTAHMQRITAAYEADDLYTLLQLLADSAPPADSATDDVLTRYTRALLQQQATLKQTLNELKYGPTSFGGPGNGKKQERELRQLRRDLRAEADYVAHTSHLLQEPGGLRTVLRELAAEGLDTV